MEEYPEIQKKNDVQFKDEYVIEFFNGINGWDSFKVNFV